MPLEDLLSADRLALLFAAVLVGGALIDEEKLRRALRTLKIGLRVRR